MGFDVTAAHVIFFIALLTGGSAAMGAYYDNAEHIEESRRLEEARTEELLHTNLTIVSASYNAGAGRFTLDIKNVGATVLDFTEFVYLVNGVYVPPTSVESATITGEPGTELLLPLETVQVKLKPISTTPSYLKVVAANGASVNWRS